ILVAGRLRQRRREFVVIEGRAAGSLFRVDQDELSGTALKVVAIPEVRVVLEPVRRDGRLEDTTLGLCGEPRGALISLAQDEANDLPRRPGRRLVLVGCWRFRTVYDGAVLHGVALLRVGRGGEGLQRVRAVLPRLLGLR